MIKSKNERIIARIVIHLRLTKKMQDSIEISDRPRHETMMCNGRVRYAKSNDRGGRHGAPGKTGVVFLCAWWLSPVMSIDAGNNKKPKGRHLMYLLGSNPGLAQPPTVHSRTEATDCSG